MDEFQSPIYLLSEDLIDRIIDTALAETIFWWPYQWSLLSSCSLTWRRFLPRSLEHLYSKIKVPSDWRDKDLLTQRIRDLNDIILERPSIADFVKEIHLLLPAGETSWIYNDPLFIEVFKLIREAEGSLKKLQLQGGPGVQRLQTPELFIKHFARPFISANITSLHIECLTNVPTQLITECVRLQELILIVADLESTSYTGRDTTCPSIKSLEHNNSRFAISKLLRREPDGSQPLIDFSSLRSLLVHTDSLGDLLFEQEIIDASKGSIEELYFSVYDWQKNPNFQAFVTLCDLSSLRILDYPVFFQTAASGSLTDICSVLNTIPEEYNSLTSLRLKLYVGFTGIAPPEDLLKADWDTLTSQILRIASRRSFDLSLHMEYLDRNEVTQSENSEDSSEEEDMDDRCEQILENVVQEHLARLNDNNRIVVTQSNKVETPHYS